MASLIQLDGTVLMRVSGKLGERPALHIAWALHQKKLAHVLAPLHEAQRWSRRFAKLAGWAARGLALGLAATCAFQLQEGTSAGAPWKFVWAFSSVLSLGAALLPRMGRSLVVRLRTKLRHNP